MTERFLAHSAQAILLALAAIILYGCQSSGDSIGSELSQDDRSQVDSRPRRASTPAASPPPADSHPLVVTPLSQAGADGQSPVATVIDARPAAMVDGKSVTWGDLRPIASDLAGAEALREVILDRKLNNALQQANVTISEDDVAAERKVLLESLSDDPNTAIRLLDELRAKQNLGKRRFEAQLRRNAGLRALVRDQVKITDEALRSMHDVAHGPKRQARLMLVGDLSTAQSAINLVNTGVSFPDVAVEMSTDSSAARGGLLEPISQSDPNYPEAIRQTLFSLKRGEMSGPVLVGDKYAVVFMVKAISADGVTLDDARPALERLVRISQERLLMDQLAHRLLVDTAVTVFDEELSESWNRARKAK